MIFEVEESVRAPVQTVWRFICDPERMTEWMPGIEAMHTQDGGPMGANSSLVYTARGAERHSNVVAFEPERQIALRSAQGPFTATYRYGLEAGENNAATRVTLRAECIASGWGRLIAPLIRVMIRNADKEQLRLLKAAVEDGR